jgi:hypothetical protein
MPHATLIISKYCQESYIKGGTRLWIRHLGVAEKRSQLSTGFQLTLESMIDKNGLREDGIDGTLHT